MNTKLASGVLTVDLAASGLGGGVAILLGGEDSLESTGEHVCFRETTRHRRR